MNRHYQFGGILGGSLLTGAAMICVSAQPAHAAATQITNVQVNQTDGGMQVVLQTSRGDRPQVFTVNRGNALIADLINTQLSLPDSSGFVQNNPAPGISSVSVAQLDANSVRVTVNGGSGAPSGQINQGQRGIVLNVGGVTQGGSANRAASSSTNSSTAASIPVPAPEVAQAPAAPATPAAPAVPAPNAPSPDVLVPNPQVTINGVPVVQPSREAAPPLLPRAVAPPLGDISVSSTDAAPEEINLGTTEVVPRLVLRDAPAREVLSLLARAAGLNVAYLDQAAGDQAQGQTAAPAQGQASAPQDVRISLDIENEPVQNVFNYVLRVANLQANRSGRTIFVGTLLPASARNNIIRTLRLNQVTAAAAASFLSAQGAETQRVVETQTRTVQGEGANQVVSTQTQTQIIPLAASAGAGPLLLRGLSVLTDERLQAVTLVGTPQQVQIAGSLLSQLDLRQRQVAVNIKIVDVNLIATDNLSSSFSFGVGDTFVLSDGGNAFINYGGTNPPNATTAGSNVLSPPAIANPFAGGNTFLDVEQPGVRIPGTEPGTLVIDQRTGGGIRRIANAAAREFLQSVGGVSSNPFRPGFTDVDLATDNVITIASDGTVSVTQGDVGSATSGLPSFFRYPTRFLASLQAQVVSGNAKILTDPTLVIQEGQQATVNLGQEVISQTNITRVDTPSGTREDVTVQKAVAGLQLQVNVSRIDDNGFVTLAIAPTVSAPVETRETGSGEVTLLSVRQLNSGQVRIRDGQTLILSGIIQETDRTTISKVPILGDIPILGALFRSTNRNNTRQEVIVLLTPRLLDDSDFSSFGYRYTPSPEAQELLQRQGVQLP